MATTSMAEALEPLKARLRQPVREREILRVAASISGDDRSQVSAAGRREILSWMQDRAGGHLPEEAWNHQGFEYLSGGRTSMGVRIETDDIDLWAIRTDDPDKEIPGRVWTTEIIVGHLGFQFQGQRLTADWHVKNGGHARDPRRCLRIYYTWDRNNQQIIVADMPAHRRTGAT